VAKIAIIGTRQPDQHQLANIKKFIDNLLFKDDIIVSGCARGVDEFALRYGKRRGHKTIGCLPWHGYNDDIYEYCDELITYNSFTDIAATASVVDHHPTYSKLNETSFKLHARNYLIIKDADLVLAYPGLKGGGTLQGIRIAIAENILLSVNPHLDKKV
jgi:predicted Rossmann fold nucleotide-binding protein DprA/Smf involved in DNA uptake